MRKSICFTISLMIVLSMTVSNAYAANGKSSVSGKTDTVNINDYSTDNWSRFTYNYDFNSGPDTKDTFGEPTQTDEAERNEETENVRRNKDAALLPPNYGVFSGEIATDHSSLYHDNTKPDYAGNVTNGSAAIDSYGNLADAYTGYNNGYGFLPATSEMTAGTGQLPMADMSVSYTQASGQFDFTGSYLYKDGSIGTLSIPKLGLSAKVYEGETLANMKKGLGHFEFTSVWNGNVGIAGHNRGSYDYLNGIWTLDYGDEVKYSTKYGERIYEVYSVEKISDTDYSKLGWSEGNTITLITCSANEPSQRYAVQAAQK